MDVKRKKLAEGLADFNDLFGQPPENKSTNGASPAEEKEDVIPQAVKSSVETTVDPQLPAQSAITAPEDRETGLKEAPVSTPSQYAGDGAIVPDKPVATGMEDDSFADSWLAESVMEMGAPSGSSALANYTSALLQPYIIERDRLLSRIETMQKELIVAEVAVAKLQVRVDELSATLTRQEEDKDKLDYTTILTVLNRINERLMEATGDDDDTKNEKDAQQGGTNKRGSWWRR